jgi:hypothetical protein
MQFSSAIPIRGKADAGWAAKRRQAAAMFVEPAQRLTYDGMAERGQHLGHRATLHLGSSVLQSTPGPPASGYALPSALTVPLARRSSPPERSATLAVLDRRLRMG